MDVFLIFYIVQMVPNHAKYHIIVEDPGWEGGLTKKRQKT